MSPVEPAEIRFTPSNLAFEATRSIWRRRATYSSLSAWRLAVLRPASVAASAFSFICDRMSEIVSPAVIAVSTID